MRLKTVMASVMLVFLGGMAGREARAQEAGEDFGLYLEASEECPYDATDKVENADCTGNTGWNRHSADAAAGYNKHNPEFDSDVYSGTGIESWYWSPLQDCELIWQDVEGLLPGRYRVTAYATGQVYNDAATKGQHVGSLCFFAGGERVEIISATWQEVEVTCEVLAGSTLRIGIAAGSDNANDWVSIAGVRLECIGAGEPETVALNEGYDVCGVTTETYADVVLSKAVPAGRLTWFCVPFDLDAAQMSVLFSEVKEVASAKKDGETLHLELQDAASISRGKPYLVKAHEAGLTVMKLADVFVNPELPQPVALGDGVTLTGTYRRLEGISGAYVLQDDGRTAMKADGYVKVKGFSAYLAVE